MHSVIVMGCHDQCLAPFAAGLAQQGHHIAGILIVEIAGRLVGENERRIIGERPGNRNTLLLTATELRRPMVASISQSYTVQEFKRQPAIDSTPWDHGYDHVLDRS